MIRKLVLLVVFSLFAHLSFVKAHAHELDGEGSRHSGVIVAVDEETGLTKVFANSGFRHGDLGALEELSDSVVGEELNSQLENLWHEGQELGSVAQTNGEHELDEGSSDQAWFYRGPYYGGFNFGYGAGFGYGAYACQNYQFYYRPWGQWYSYQHQWNTWGRSYYFYW